MKDIQDFFQGLFATNKWPARWNCGEWSNFHGWVYITSELMIWIAYFLMPVLILKYLSTKRMIIKFQKVYVLFASFILLCGSTHFLDAMMFWIPMYRFNALVRLATGIVSLFTVYHLVKILPDVFKQKTNIELENEIIRRMEAESKLAEANKNLETFAYVASHDLQEPLRKIKFFSQRIKDLQVKIIDEKSEDYLQKVIASTERMQKMVKDILTLSTLSSELVFNDVSTGKAVLEAMQNLEIRILESGAVINLNELPAVRGNEEYLSLLFMNLIGNSIKFSKEKPVIDIYGETKDGKAVIYVKDNGIGMDESNTNNIFETFQRLHGKSQYEGSGIGLSICKKIVQLHGGTINVKSKLGEGSTFIIVLTNAENPEV
ncbi:MAG TPA: ATP-binding protein [Segetibacter sp.]